MTCGYAPGVPSALLHPVDAARQEPATLTSGQQKAPSPTWGAGPSGVVGAELASAPCQRVDQRREGDIVQRVTDVVVCDPGDVPDVGHGRREDGFEGVPGLGVEHGVERATSLFRGGRRDETIGHGGLLVMSGWFARPRSLFA